MTAMTKRYFYTDPLAAAWMAKNFGMIFQFQGECASDSFTAQNGYRAEISIRHIPVRGGLGDSPAYLRIDFGDWVIPEKHYIQPDSLHLLEPQVDDIGIVGIPEMPVPVKFTKGILDNCAILNIIKRNNIPFMCPEMEEV